MVTRVEFSRFAQKQLKTIPLRIAQKLLAWADGVEQDGLEEMRKIPGYHDEPLKGSREGQRSIRLNRSYRAIYEIRSDQTAEFVCIEEVNKHDY